MLGPEAPLIALGSGLGALAVRLATPGRAAAATAVIAAAGSFAAISSLLGSPLVGAFLLLEAAGLGGPMLGVVLVPGLLAAGVGTLIFVGLDALTGLGTFSLTAHRPARVRPARRSRCSDGRSSSASSPPVARPRDPPARASPSGRASSRGWSC